MSEATKHIGKKELRAYTFGALGQGMIYATMSSFISDYYISVLGLSAWFVFWLMLLARVWDAINDPMMGMVVDHYTTKWGKMKPYILFTAAPIAILSFLMYFCPPALRGHSSPLMVYCSIIYVLWGMTYTVSDVPFWSLPNVMTPDPAERANTISVGRTLNGIGSAVPVLLFAMLGLILPKFIPSDAANFGRTEYLIIAMVTSVLGIIPFVRSYFHIHERVLIPPKPRQKGSSALKRIFTCKPLVLVIIMGVLSSGRYMMQAAAVHVSRYAFYPKNTAGMTKEQIATAISHNTSIVYTILQVCAAAGMFGAMLFMPYLMKRFSYRKIVIVTCLAGFVSSLITTAVGYFLGNIYVCIPFIFLQCVPLGVLNVVSYAMIGDSLDYMEWKTGFRDNALGSACQSFVNKLGNAIATSGICLMYIAAKIDVSNMVSKGMNTASVAMSLNAGQRFSMFSLISLIPGICLLLCCIPIFFYDLDGKKAQITEELSQRRAEAGISTD